MSRIFAKKGACKSRLGTLIHLEISVGIENRFNMSLLCFGIDRVKVWVQVDTETRDMEDLSM